MTTKNDVHNDISTIWQTNVDIHQRESNVSTSRRRRWKVAWNMWFAFWKWYRDTVVLVRFRDLSSILCASWAIHKSSLLKSILHWNTTENVVENNTFDYKVICEWWILRTHETEYAYKNTKYKNKRMTFGFQLVSKVLLFSIVCVWIVTVFGQWRIVF